MTEDVTEHVVAWLKDKLPPFVPEDWGATGERVLVSLNANKAAFNNAVKIAFTEWSGAFPQRQTMFEDVMKHVAPISQTLSPPDDAESAHTKAEQLRHEFTRPYRGDFAPTQLEQFVVRCWRVFCKNFAVHRFPYTTIVQSSGFGKSRLLYELATRVKKTRGADAHMRVLYTCVRDSPSSNGFPKTTANLREYFFPASGTETELVERLCRLFDFAMSCWDTVGDDWIDLFINQAHDATVHAAISSFGRRPAVKGKKLFDDISKRRIVVLGIDEARALLKTLGQDESWFRRLRRALGVASHQIRAEYGQFAGIFAILVDTNSKISDPTPPASVDDSGRGSDGESVLFPPFVLTHTMDINFDSLVSAAQSRSVSDSLAFYQEQVLDATQHEASLISMGRPLWESCHERLHFNGVIDLAARKLLRNLRSHDADSLNEVTMWGIASMLCRLGIRPFSSSAFASQVVAEFMAVLSYVTTSKDHFISTYASEPLLAFGAASVWYSGAVDSDHHLLLHERILPQLRKLMHQEVVDTGGIGELVARLVLLLAMDTVGVHTSDDLPSRCYSGKFHCVWEFLSVLQGETPSIEDIFGQNADDESMADMEAFKAKWSQWRVGFSHFVQLTKEPTEECLWAMLARRAAGLFPRNFKGVDLVIPVFKDTEVSMILVQVKNRVDGDPSFPDSATIAMRPKSVFVGEKFRSKTGDDVIRVYMSLRGTKEPRRFFLRDPGERRSSRSRVPRGSRVDSTLANVTANTKVTKSKPSPEPKSFVLCMYGLDAWNVESSTDGDSVVFLSKEVVAALTHLLEPWWQPLKLVEADLKNRRERFGVSDEVAKAEASRPLVEEVVEAKWSRVKRATQAGNSMAPVSDSDDDGQQPATTEVVETPGRKATGKRNAACAKTIAATEPKQKKGRR